MTVRNATFELLRRCGMTTVFGNPGSTELAFLQDWPEDFRYILGLQECAVIGMADGYAQASRSAAFVNLHSAAGVGHALGGIYTAYRNQTPLVITAGQQARELLPLRPFLGASSATEFPKPYVKWSCEPARAADVPLAIAQAHSIAMQRPCGPTFVSVPADDWSQPAAELIPLAKSRDVAPDPGLLSELAGVLQAARRPALVLGAGVAREDAMALAVQLAERVQGPVWTEALASRSPFPEDHPLFAGFLPAAPSALAKILAQYDAVVVLGAAAFTFHVPGDLQSVRKATRVFQITDDPELAATALHATSIVSSVRLAIDALIRHLPEKSQPSAGFVRAVPERIPPSDPMPAEWVMQTIADVRTAGSVVVEEAPSHKQAMQRYLRIRDGGFYAMASGGLGYGLAAAAGIALADPKRHVICIVGDGSAMYSIQALWTAAQHGLPVTYVVLNNGGYGALRAFSQFMNVGTPPGMDLPLLDFVSIARGMGCEGCRVDRAQDLAPALAAAFSKSKPTVVEVAVDSAVTSLFRSG